jgi:predicted PurR-regulated permease PerM
MIEQAGELIQASVTSSLIVGAVQGALGGITFALLGIDGAIFWGVVMAFCALIPLLGTGIILGPAVVWLLIQGSFVKAGILAAVAVGVIGLADNFLRPILIGNRAQLGTLLIFISVLGGISAFGMVGLVAGPIVMATALSVANAYAQPAPKKRKE